MKKSTLGFFIFSSGILFLLTASAKLISIIGTARILNNTDPIFSLSFRHLLFGAAIAELGVAGVCLAIKNRNLQAASIALLSTNFAMYRLGLYWMGYGAGCQCLGNLTDALHISPKTADTAMKIVLGYLLLGSYIVIFSLWRQHKAKVLSSVSSSL